MYRLDQNWRTPSIIPIYALPQKSTKLEYTSYLFFLPCVNLLYRIFQSTRLFLLLSFFFFNDPAPPEISPLSLPDALPIFLQVAHRNRQLLDREIARFAHRDERSALGDELFEVVDAGLADAAAILGANGRRVEAVDDPARILIGDDDRVELLAQLAVANLRVVDGRQVEFVLLEHPARPALVHIAARPRLIHGAARRLEGKLFVFTFLF